VPTASRGDGTGFHATCFFAALLVFVTIIGIALALHPLAGCCAGSAQDKRRLQACMTLDPDHGIKPPPVLT
jgi:hypothetical protein